MCAVSGLKVQAAGPSLSMNKDDIHDRISHYTWGRTALRKVSVVTLKTSLLSKEYRSY